MVTTASAAGANKQLSEVSKNLASSKKNEAALAAELVKNARELHQLAVRSAALAESLQKTESRVSTQESKVESLGGELAAKQKEFDIRKQEYADTVTSLLALHRIPPTAMFADPDNLHTMLRTASVLENTNEALAGRALELKRQLKELKTLKTRVGKQREELGRERTQLTVEQQTLKKELEARQAAQTKLAVDHEKAEAHVAELSRQSHSLQDLLGKLAREPAAKKSRESRDFVGAKGNMRTPAVGDVIHNFGEKKNENETWRGMVLRARPGGTVVAPYDGEVVFTGPFRDYGRMVLLKHSNGFISLLAGLGAIQVGLNQTVGKGEPVGTMPNQAAPELYVELRDRSKPIDPADWFANVGRRLAKS